MATATGTTTFATTTRTVDVRTLLAEVDELPSIPETLIRILKVLDDPASGPADLTRVVRMDAPVMAKVLRLANSPYYSSRADLADINRCVAVLGYRTVRQVAICITVASSLMSAMENAGGQMDYRELWRHSVVTGAVSRHLARLVGYPDPEEAFTAGLLHDLGKFVLEVYAPQVYGKLIADRHARGLTLPQIEQATFGFDHAALGAAFAESWRFPPLLVHAFGEHHQPVLGRATTREAKVTAVVALADYLANTIDPPRGDLGFDLEDADPVRLHATAGLTVEATAGELEAIREDIARASAFLTL